MFGHQSVFLGGPIRPSAPWCVSVHSTQRLRLRDQALVVQQIGERHEAVEEVGAALPALARAAEPAAVRTDIGPELVEMSGQALGLDLQLTPQPARGPDGAQRERHECFGMQRLTALDRRCRRRLRGGFRCCGNRERGDGDRTGEERL